MQLQRSTSVTDTG